jgi:hypothetical protein
MLTASAGAGLATGTQQALAKPESEPLLAHSQRAVQH